MENLSFVTKPPSGDLRVERKQKLRKLFLKKVFSILCYQGQQNKPQTKPELSLSAELGCRKMPRTTSLLKKAGFEEFLSGKVRTLRTSMGTCVAGGRLVGTLTLMAGVWLTGTRCCMNWAACCFCCCSRRSCSCICSRMSCCRSRIREVMLEELKGGLEAPGCSELLWEDQRKDSSASTKRDGGSGGRSWWSYGGMWGVMGEEDPRHGRRGILEFGADLLQVLSGHLRLP